MSQVELFDSQVDGFMRFSCIQHFSICSQERDTCIRADHQLVNVSPGECLQGGAPREVRRVPHSNLQKFSLNRLAKTLHYSTETYKLKLLNQELSSLFLI